MKPSTVSFSDHEGQKQKNKKNHKTKKTKKDVKIQATKKKNNQTKRHPTKSKSRVLATRPHRGSTPAGAPRSGPGTGRPHRVLAGSAVGTRPSVSGSGGVGREGASLAGPVGGSVFHPVFLSQPPTPKAVWSPAAAEQARGLSREVLQDLIFVASCAGGPAGLGGAGSFHPRGSTGPHHPRVTSPASHLPHARQSRPCPQPGEEAVQQ